MFELGYACINTELDKMKIKVNHSCIAKTVEKHGKQLLIEKTIQNLESLLQIIEWNHDNNIHFYRMSSNMFPHITNERFTVQNDMYAYPLQQFQSYFDRIGFLADKYNQRLTFHPSHFNQIGTPNPDVFEKTIKDLSYHADVLDMCNRNKHSVMVVHGGGTYKNKQETMQRWVKQFNDLPPKVQNRLVIENCERQYSVEDVLYLSSKVDRPVVFDTHHHNCYNQLVEPQKDPTYYLHDILLTWNKHAIKPKFHISEQDPSKRIGAHSKIVETIPHYFFDLYQNIDLMIEAKDKEQAVFHLKNKYSL